MSPQVKLIEVKGIKEALAELNTIDKKLRRSFTVEYKTIVAPMVADAVNLVPVKAPMSGWNRNWLPRGSTRAGGILPWSEGAPPIRPYVSGKRPQTTGQYTRNLAAFGMKWADKTSVLFDTSGQAKTKQGAQMVETLGNRFGPPSRAMWRAYEQSSLDVQYEIRQLVEKIMRAVGRNIEVV
jgi:hypothetical protein